MFNRVRKIVRPTNQLVSVMLVAGWSSNPGHAPHVRNQHTELVMAPHIRPTVFTFLEITGLQGHVCMITVQGLFLQRHKKAGSSQDFCILNQRFCDVLGFKEKPNFRIFLQGTD